MKERSVRDERGKDFKNEESKITRLIIKTKECEFIYDDI
jgi:hypothetical protein